MQKVYNKFLSARMKGTKQMNQNWQALQIENNSKLKLSLTGSTGFSLSFLKVCIYIFA